MMKTLKIMNRINTLALAAYIPYIILNYENFFWGKNRNGGIIALSILIFVTTFICGGTILIIADNKNIENSFSLSEIKNVGKGTLAVLIATYLIGAIILVIFIHSEALLFYFATETIALIFVICEKIVIQKIDISPYFKISMPWYLYPIPFVVFLGGSFLAINILGEEYQGRVIITLFICAGIMMSYLAWHSYYMVDTESKTIEKFGGGISLFKSNNEIISFENIQYVKKNGFYYNIVSSDTEMKINRFFSSTQKLKDVLYDNGIPIQ